MPSTKFMLNGSLNTRLVGFTGRIHQPYLAKEVFKLLIELPIGLLIHFVFIQFAM